VGKKWAVAKFRVIVDIFLNIRGKMEKRATSKCGPTLSLGRQKPKFPNGNLFYFCVINNPLGLLN
jgi:hypothetical protein